VAAACAALLVQRAVLILVVEVECLICRTSHNLVTVALDEKLLLHPEGLQVLRAATRKPMWQSLRQRSAAIKRHP
jgi:hypothetical protein